MLYNPRSIVNKVDEVMMTIKDRNIDIAAICESWLVSKNNPTTAKIKQHGYHILHDFRSGQRGGGTAFIYKSSILLTPISLNKTFDSFEYTVASLKSLNGTKIVFLVVYRPGSMCGLFIKELDTLLSDLLLRCDCLVLAGDLNTHFEHNGNNLYQQTLQMLESCGMKRQVFEPTHLSGSCLDHIFTFSLHGQLQSSVAVDGGNTLHSDHFPVYCDLDLSFEKKYMKVIEYRKLKDLEGSDFPFEFRCLLNQCILIKGDFKKSVSQLFQGSQQLLDEYVPIIKKTIPTVNEAPWFDAEYRQLRKLRRRAERVKSRNIDNKIHYKDLCLECTQLANTKKKEYFSNLIKKAQGNSKTLYALVNKELDRGQATTLPDCADVSQLADSFNHFFEDKIEKIRDEMHSNKQQHKFDSLPQMKLMHKFSPTNIDEIKDIIGDCGIKCSPADFLPTSLLKENINDILPALVHLVNLSLSTGCMDGMKLADIIPSLKNDHLDPNVLKHFRPVSNLTFIGKLIERVVLKRLNEHLSLHNLNRNEQSAYKKCHSTETLLIRIWNDLLVATDQKSCTVMMMLDLSAAFDTVDHQLLIKILKHEIGLRGTVLDWFKSFLIGRSQRIRLGSTLSEEIIIKFGVPQGSVLGPVLFNIYIRSIYVYVQKLGFTIHGYADDHQVLLSFKPLDQSIVLVYGLMYCFEQIKLWMNRYYLQLNDSKTEFIIFGSNRLLNQIKIGGLNFPSGISIRFVSLAKNLGIHLDSKLTLRNQIVQLKKNSFRTIRNINKIRFLLSRDQLKIVVNSLVVSCLDYCNSLYFGISEKLLYQLQLIQNACAKTITGKYKHDHMDNDLNELHWLDVRKRVLFKIALLSFKSVVGLAPSYLQELFTYAHHGHNLKLIVPTFNTSYGNNSFSVIGPKLWNRLPNNIKSATDINLFKKLLKTFLFNLSLNEVKMLIS